MYAFDYIMAGATIVNSKSTVVIDEKPRRQAISTIHQHKGNTMDLKFSVGDKVKVTDLDFINGRVYIVQISKDGVEYQVRYFDGVEPKYTWFYADELEKV